MSKILFIDEEYWSIEFAFDKVKYIFGDDVCEHCADGGHDISLLQKNNYSCLILDIMFPLGEDFEIENGNSQPIDGGLIILKMIRETLDLKIPVICLTFRNENEVKKEIEKYNAKYIKKTDEKAIEILVDHLKKIVKNGH